MKIKQNSEVLLVYAVMINSIRFLDDEKFTKSDQDFFRWFRLMLFVVSYFPRETNFEK